MMLARKIQEESLRTYLFTYSKVYDSISTTKLAETFELEKSTVHAIVSKMIINEELMASLDEPTECMVMHRTEPTRLQSLSLQLSDKIAQLVDNNERLLEFRVGGWRGEGGWKGDGNRDRDRKDGEKGVFGGDKHRDRDGGDRRGDRVRLDRDGGRGGRSGYGDRGQGRFNKRGGGGGAGGDRGNQNHRNNWNKSSGRE